MGMFSDARSIRNQAKAMTPPEHRGPLGGFRAARDGMASANEALQRLEEHRNRVTSVNASGGRSGEAVIFGLRDTGVTVNECPQVQFDLLVTAEGFAPFSVTAEQIIDRLAISRCQPGQRVPVQFDPAAPTKIVVLV